MKKLFAIFALILTATLASAQVQVGKTFIIDTTVTTMVGFNLTKTAVQFRPNFQYGNSTVVTYEFRTFVDTVAMNRGDQPIIVNDKFGQQFKLYAKTYSLMDFLSLTPAKMYDDVLGILEEKFGNNIIQ